MLNCIGRGVGCEIIVEVKVAIPGSFLTPVEGPGGADLDGSRFVVGEGAACVDFVGTDRRLERILLASGGTLDFLGAARLGAVVVAASMVLA